MKRLNLAKTDLHMHSMYSDDGEFSPRELVETCKAAGITTMALTDHNCVRGVTEAMDAATECNIRCIPAIEIDCTFQGTDFHVLGYRIDHTSPDFARIDRDIDLQSTHTSRERLRKIQALGFAVTEQDMTAAEGEMYWKGRWTGELFAEVLLAKAEYRSHPLLAPYRPGGSRSDNPYVNFYWDFCAQGKPCYVPEQYPDMREVIEIIHRNGGDAVLAHPGANLKGKESMLDAICALGIDGIEAFTSYHDRERTAFYCREARRLGLYVTCGSDYHGKTKPAIQPGQFVKTDLGD